MQSRWLLLAILASAILLSSAAAAPPEVDRNDPVARLVEQLGSPRYTEREAAERTLEACGLPAMSALRQACRSTDPEVQRRALELTGRIERRLESSRLLLPSRVRLSYNNTPLTDALADLRRKTGMTLDFVEAEPAQL